jgi:hypothetical protein
MILLSVLGVVVFMALQDVFGVGLTISQARGLATYPGLFDAAGDFVSRYGGAISAVAAVNYGILSGSFFLITLAVAATSYFTSNLATGKESRLLPASRIEQMKRRHHG